jgi:hypothetical protein
MSWLTSIFAMLDPSLVIERFTYPPPGSTTTAAPLAFSDGGR